MTIDRSILEIEALPFWTGPIQIWPLTGGITNRNYGVQQADGQRFAVRLGQDKPEHGVLRFNEQAAAKAAARAGISPKIFYTAPGVMISRLLPGRCLTPAEVKQPENLLRISALLRRCHVSMFGFLQGPLMAFWVFHVNRNYAAALARTNSRIAHRLPRLMEVNEMLESRVGRVEVTFSHNDLLAANVFDDGARLWLLDWDYAGFNSPLFDLANLSSNNLLTPDEDDLLLSAYWGNSIAPDDFNAFTAFKCASLVREILWSATSELTSDVQFDFARYTDEYFSRLEMALQALD